MDDRGRIVPMPATREPMATLSVERAVSDMRRGRAIVIAAAGGEAALAQAAEAVTPEALSGLAALAQSQPRLGVTARRAAVLGLGASGLRVVTLTVDDSLDAVRVRMLSDPLSGMPTPPPFAVSVSEPPPHGCDSAAVRLAKVARLLPAAVTAPLNDPEAADLAAWAVRHRLLMVDAGDVFQYDAVASGALKCVSEASVPLMDAVQTRVLAFRPRDGGLEHLALVIGSPSGAKPILTRIHSECFTGDLLGSLRCDCGDQLRGAIREIAAANGGVLLYLAQEGRGIGLVNKLRAYTLQDRGFDTIDANEQLGFDADERVYLPAARMLNYLGFRQVRLLTNNPAKVSGLARCGIDVVERVPHAFPSNRHNEAYIRTKAARGGHLF